MRYSKIQFRDLLGPIFISVFTFLPFTSHAVTEIFTEAYHWAEMGAVKSYYNKIPELEWENQYGDFTDSLGVKQGSTPYTSTRFNNDVQKFVSLDVTTLVNEWLSGTHINKGFYLTMSGYSDFVSREDPRTNLHPKLEVTTGNGVQSVPLQADLSLSNTDVTLRGHDLILSANGVHKPILLRFDFAGISGPVLNASLSLYSLTDNGNTNRQLHVFRSSQGLEVDNTVQLGIAKGYIDDVGIENHPSVLYAQGFEDNTWLSDFDGNGESSNISTIQSDDARHKYTPFQGKSLRALIAQGTNGGLSLNYIFQGRHGYEPEAMYFRYYLRFSDSWTTTYNGKLPGFAGRYNTAGWGGRTSDGTNGWSARGTFKEDITEQDNPLYQTVPIGNYVYHKNQAGQYGDSDVYDLNYVGVLKKGKWYSVEQYVKLNTPGQDDGIIMAWIDGVLAYNTSNYHFRDVLDLKIEEIWFNTFHGGTVLAPTDLVTYMDNIVVSTEYIGPINRNSTPPVLSSGLPSGTLTARTTSTNLTLSTDKSATCKYSTISSTDYISMTNTFTTTGATSHSKNVTGLTDGSSYNYYVRCQDTTANVNTTDYTIMFSIGIAPPVLHSPIIALP